MALLNSTTVEGNLTVKELLNIVEELKVNNGLILNVNNNQFTYKGANVITDAGGAGGIVPISVQYAAQLKTPRTITFTGDATGSVSFDGSQNVSVQLTHKDMSSQESISTTAPTMLQNIQLDTMGHVTGVTTYNLDGRYYTETESNTLLATKTDKTTQVIAGNGLSGGGDLSTNRTLSIVSADDGIVVNSDSIKLNVDNTVTSTSNTRPASANSVNVAFTKATEGLTTANTKVSKSGDTMTGALQISGAIPATPTHNSVGIVRFGTSGVNYTLGTVNSNGNFVLNKFNENVFAKTMLEIPNAGTALRFDSARVYHENFKPTKSDVGLGNLQNWPVSSAHNDSSTNTYATTLGVKSAYDKGQEAYNLASTKADKTVQIIAGQGIAGGGVLNSNVTLNLASTSAGLVVGTDSIGLSLVNDLTTGGTDKAPTADTVVTLKRMIDALQSSGGAGSGGAIDIGSNENFGEVRYNGTLAANATDINLGKLLYHPSVYIAGTKIPQELFTCELTTGHIKLKSPWDVSYPWEYEVIDKYPFHIKFSYPTLNLLIAQNQMKASIKLGDVIKILGETNPDDGGCRLIKCEATSKLNGVDIGEGRFLNEIPESRIGSKLNKGSYTGTAQDLKNLIDTKFDKSSGTLTNDLIIRKDGYSSVRLQNSITDKDREFIFQNRQNNAFAIGHNFTNDKYSYLNFRLPDEGNYDLYHSGHKPTPADIGAVNKAGDTLTGPLKLKSNQYGGNVGLDANNSVISRIESLAFDSSNDQTEGIWFPNKANANIANPNDYWKMWCDKEGCLKINDKKIYNELFKPTPADIGAVNKAGDIMTGPLAVQSSIEASKILSSTQKEITYGWGGVQLISQQTNGTGLEGSVPSNPKNNWYHHMIFNHADERGYYVDMALSYHEPDYRIRRMVNGNLGEWDRLLTDTTSPIDIIYSSNFNSGPTTFQIPTDKRGFRGYLVTVYTIASSLFDGVSTYFIPVTDSANLRYGYYYSSHYNYIGLGSDWVIKPGESSGVLRRIISVVGVDRIL